jgi:hypothetical protein
MISVGMSLWPGVERHGRADLAAGLVNDFEAGVTARPLHATRVDRPEVAYCTRALDVLERLERAAAPRNPSTAFGASARRPIASASRAHQRVAYITFPFGP